MAQDSRAADGARVDRRGAQFNRGRAANNQKFTCPDMPRFFQLKNILKIIGQKVAFIIYFVLSLQY